METSGQSMDEIEKFIKNQIIRGNRKILDNKSAGKARGWDHSDNDKSGNTLALQSQNLVGQRGEAFQIQIIGTDASTNNHAVTLASFQANNEFRSSDVSDFVAQITPTLDLGGTKKLDHSNATDSKGEQRSISTSLPNIEKKSLSNEKCKNLIQTLYQSQEIQRIIKSTKTSLVRAKESLSRSRYSNQENSTSIGTEYNIGSDGFAIHISHIGRGEATNSATATDDEIQVHENIKDSKVNLFNLIIIPARLQ
ncbi:uncharacterized protein LOC141849315 isoform X2 [Brevipalpus obovatus]